MRHGEAPSRQSEAAGNDASLWTDLEGAVRELEAILDSTPDSALVVIPAIGQAVVRIIQASSQVIRQRPNRCSSAMLERVQGPLILATEVLLQVEKDVGRSTDTRIFQAMLGVRSSAAVPVRFFGTPSHGRG